MTQTYSTGGGDHAKTVTEQIEVLGSELEAKIKELVHEGTVRHLIIKHDGHTLLEIPVGIGVITALLLPVFAAVAALGAALTHCTVEVIRTVEPE